MTRSRGRGPSWQFSRNHQVSRGQRMAEVNRIQCPQRVLAFGQVNQHLALAHHFLALCDHHLGSKIIQILDDQNISEAPRGDRANLPRDTKCSAVLIVDIWMAVIGSSPSEMACRTALSDAPFIYKRLRLQVIGAQQEAPRRQPLLHHRLHLLFHVQPGGPVAHHYLHPLPGAHDRVAGGGALVVILRSADHVAMERQSEVRRGVNPPTPCRRGAWRSFRRAPCHHRCTRPGSSSSRRSPIMRRARSGLPNFRGPRIAPAFSSPARKDAEGTCTNTWSAAARRHPPSAAPRAARRRRRSMRVDEHGGGAVRTLRARIGHRHGAGFHVHVPVEQAGYQVLARRVNDMSSCQWYGKRPVERSAMRLARMATSIFGMISPVLHAHRLPLRTTRCAAGSLPDGAIHQFSRVPQPEESHARCRVLSRSQPLRSFIRQLRYVASLNAQKHPFRVQQLCRARNRCPPWGDCRTPVQRPGRAAP